MYSSYVLKLAVDCGLKPHRKAVYAALFVRLYLARTDRAGVYLDCDFGVFGKFEIFLRRRDKHCDVVFVHDRRRAAAYVESVEGVIF